MTYPTWVCDSCGMRFGKREPKSATWHKDICGVCGRISSVTEPRDFGHLTLPPTFSQSDLDQINSSYHKYMQSKNSS